MRGTTKAKVHATFSRRIDELVEDAAAQATALTVGGGRPYTRDSSLDGRDLLHVPSLHDNGYDRNEINTNYDQVTQSAKDPGTAGDAASLKLQASYNATEERAFRARHATIIRCTVHAHARLQGHGNSVGIFGRVKSEAVNLIKAGGT
jgi:hypothetical protein